MKEDIGTEIRCPNCHGKGCKGEECEGSGHFVLDRCPHEFIGDFPMRDLSLLADLFRKGLPPVAGGTLDQANWFFEASQFLWSEQDLNGG